MQQGVRATSSVADAKWGAPPLSHTKSFKVVLQKSTPTQIRQLILYIGISKGYVDDFVGESTSYN